MKRPASTFRESRLGDDQEQCAQPTSGILAPILASTGDIVDDLLHGALRDTLHDTKRKARDLRLRAVDMERARLSNCCDADGVCTDTGTVVPSRLALAVAAAAVMSQLDTFMATVGRSALLALSTRSAYACRRRGSERLMTSHSAAAPSTCSGAVRVLAAPPREQFSVASEARQRRGGERAGGEDGTSGDGWSQPAARSKEMMIQRGTEGSRE